MTPADSVALDALAGREPEMDWYDLRMAVCRAAPDLDPPPQYWLESDCSSSYCRQCVMIARGKEFDLGTPLHDCDYWERDEWERAFWDGISSYAHGNGGEGDNTASCEICGVTLDYWLTDYGIKAEIGHWSDAKMSGDLSEIAHNLDRLFECAEEDKPAVREIAERFLTHAARAHGSAVK